MIHRDAWEKTYRDWVGQAIVACNRNPTPDAIQNLEETDAAFWHFLNASSAATDETERIGGRIDRL